MNLFLTTCNESILRISCTNNEIVLAKHINCCYTHSLYLLREVKMKGLTPIFVFVTLTRSIFILHKLEPESLILVTTTRSSQSVF